jgi:HD-like signal output (HDOD) protein
MKIHELIDHSNLLPTMPKVVQDMLSSLDDDQATLEQIGQKMAADQALTAKLLRLTNSAFHSASRKVSSVDEAVSLLGLEAVRSRVVSYGIAGMFRDLPALNLKKLWRYSVYSAGIARFLAARCALNAELTFTTATLHTVGQLVMHAAMPREMALLERTVGWTDPRCLVAERELLGYTHLNASAELCRHWHFPDAMAQALQAAEEPLQAQSALPMAAVLHLALWRARAYINRLTPLQMAATFPSEVAAHLGIEPALLIKDVPLAEELLAGAGDLDD